MLCTRGRPDVSIDNQWERCSGSMGLGADWVLMLAARKYSSHILPSTGVTRST